MMMRYLLPLLLALLVASAAYAVALGLTSSVIDQLGRGEASVSRYHVRVLSASLTVNSNVFNNQITGGSVSVASTVPGTYVLTITLTSGAASRTVTVTAALSTTPTTVSFTVSPALPYVSPGVAVTVRAEPA